MMTASGPPRPRIVLAEDQAATSALLEHLLQTEFDVVATVRDGKALVEAAARLSPDAIVTDVFMPGVDGIDAARTILASNPSARVVFVSVNTDPLLMQRGLAAGALGYVPKLLAGEELVPAIRAALRGERWYLWNS